MTTSGGKKKDGHHFSAALRQEQEVLAFLQDSQCQALPQGTANTVEVSSADLLLAWHFSNQIH